MLVNLADRQSIYSGVVKSAKKPRSRIRPEPGNGVLHTRDLNLPQNDSGQDIDLGAREPALTVEKWLRGPVVENVEL